MFATDQPSIWRWKARFHPKFGTLCTIRRPGSGLPCATVPTDIAHAKARIRRTLLTKLRLRFTEHIMPGTGFWPEPIDHLRDPVFAPHFPRSRDGLAAPINPKAYENHRSLSSYRFCLTYTRKLMSYVGRRALAGVYGAASGIVDRWQQVDN